MKTLIQLGESILPFISIWTLFTALLRQIFAIPKNLFLMEFGTVMIALAATTIVWLFALWGASECIRDQMKGEAGVFRFFWSMPDLVHLIAERAETSVSWRIAIILLSPLLPAWIGLLGTIVIIDLFLTIFCAFGHNWTGRFIPIAWGTILGIVGMSIWGWASLLYCIIAGALIALIGTIVALPIMPLSEHIERRAARCS